MLPTDYKTRKESPIASGVLDYFPDALAAVAHVSKVGNDQHNPGQEMHWARGKSSDHADCIIRHLADRDHIDTDDIPHVDKVAWRALALSQEYHERKKIEAGMTREEAAGRASVFPVEKANENSA
jgi:hypothetical protein